MSKYQIEYAFKFIFIKKSIATYQIDVHVTTYKHIMGYELLTDLL